MFSFIKKIFCIPHSGDFTLKNPTGESIYDKYGGPMDEYKTTCNKCGKAMFFYF